ncbi:MAG: Hsp20/alpha crystallin family protein [Promethearchaeota archaeon]
MTEETAELQVQEKEEVESATERTRDRIAFVPRADIYETDEAIFLLADMPGVDEKSVDITLEKGELTINGYVEPVQPEGYALTYAEYRVGDYQRSFALSNRIDQEKIEATLKNGVLRLRLPKVGPVKRTIAVKTG